MNFPDPEDSYVVPDDGALGDRVGQMFPALDTAQVERLMSLGERQSWNDGDLLFEAGKIGAGLFVVLSGWVVITNRDARGDDRLVVEQGAGQFLAEVGQLSGKPALVDGRARGVVETLLLDPEALRQLLIVDAAIQLRIASGIAGEGASPNETTTVHALAARISLAYLF